MGKLFFTHVAAAPADAILGLTAAFNADERSNKVNLSVGLCRTEDLQTPVMRCVKKAEALILEKEQTKEYLPIEGLKNYLHGLGELIFGNNFWQAHHKRIAAFQTPGGTGALRVGGDFLKMEITETIALSDPTWPNHKGVFSHCGMKVESYPYYDFQKHSLHWEEMVRVLRGLTPGSAVLFQAKCHNPTGLDLTLGQWKTVAGIVRENALLPFFDFAYQGLGEGLEEDAEAVRLFANEGIEMLVASSQSKNFGLYGERIGALFILAASEKSAHDLLSKLKTIARTLYSNPPMHGAKIVAEILSSPPLRKEWEAELKSYRGRITEMRALLAEALGRGTKKRDFSYLANRSGMFCFTGLNRAEVERLRAEFAIYMILDGRINVAGLNRHNLQYVADAILQVVD